MAKLNYKAENRGLQLELRAKRRNDGIGPDQLAGGYYVKIEKIG
jgi:hypothetical protein